MLRQLKALKEEVDKLVFQANPKEEGDTSVAQVHQILAAQLKSLEWISQQCAALENKLRED